MDDGRIPCGRCGADNPPEAVVCASCGAVLAAYTPPAGAQPDSATAAAPPARARRPLPAPGGEPADPGPVPRADASDPAIPERVVAQLPSPTPVATLPPDVHVGSADVRGPTLDAPESAAESIDPSPAPSVSPAAGPSVVPVPPPARPPAPIVDVARIDRGEWRPVPAAPSGARPVPTRRGLSPLGRRASSMLDAPPRERPPDPSAATAEGVVWLLRFGVPLLIGLC